MIKSILLLALVATSACSFKKTADEMKSSMDEMNAYTREIKAQSERLGDSTDNLQHEMTYDRSAASMELNLRYMWNEESSPRSVTEPDILLYAGITMKSMWSQFWTGKKTENIQSLDERMETSTEILMVRVKSHSPSAHHVNVFKPDVSYIGVAALAAKLDFTRYEFTRALARKGIKPFTYYDVFVNAIRNRDALERTELLPLTTRKILQHEQDAIYMLQLRHNFLPLMVYASLTQFKDMRDWERFVTQHVPQQVNLETFGPEQLVEWTSWLQAARQTRADLKALGIDPEYNAAFQRILGRLELVNVPSERLTGQRRLQRDFAEAYRAILTSAP